MKNKILTTITGILAFLCILFMASAAEGYKVTFSLIGAWSCLMWMIPFFIVNRGFKW